MRMRTTAALAAAAVLLAGTAGAEVPHVFNAGDPALASEVNENFADLDRRLLDLEDAIDVIEITVDCDAGDSLAAAIDALPEAGGAIVTVQGACTDTVVITRTATDIRGVDGASVAFNGPDPESGFDSVINVFGAQRVTIENLTLSGGATAGVHVKGTATVRIVDSVLENNGLRGLFVQWGGYVQMEGTTIRGNGESGVFARNGALVDMLQGNTIEQQSASNGEAFGVGAFVNSSVRIQGGNNLIRNLADPALGLVAALSAFHSSTIRSANGHATVVGEVQAGNFAYVSLRDTTVRGDGSGIVLGNIEVFSLGSVDLRESGATAQTSVTGNVNVGESARFAMTNGASLTGDVDCVRCSIRLGGSASATGNIELFERGRVRITDGATWTGDAIIGQFARLEVAGNARWSGDAVLHELARILASESGVFQGGTVDCIAFPTGVVDPNVETVAGPTTGAVRSIQSGQVQASVDVDCQG